MKRTPYDEFCTLIILSILKKEGKIVSSYYFHHLFTTLLGIINEVVPLIEIMTKEDLITYQGRYDTSGLYKDLQITDKGLLYLKENISKVVISQEDLLPIHIERIRKILELS